jgi:hypothetical protein
MSWLEDVTDTSAETKVADEKWLKIPDPQLGKTTEVRLRILDEEPVGVWRHWQGSRPYNCPIHDVKKEGIGACPACKARFAAKKVDPDGYRANFKMDYRYYFNVFVDGKVKIWSFSSGVGRKLKVFLEKYGDLRDYDVSIRKRKTGPQIMNVEYDVIYETPTALSVEDALLAEDRYDLSEYIQPARQDELTAIASGESPLPAESTAAPSKATRADMIMLKTLVERKGFSLSDFGLVETSPPAKDVVTKLIEELKSEK